MKTSSMVPPIRPGMNVRTRAIFPYPLPIGLPPGAEVTVLRVDEGLCLVRDAANREWTLDLICVDPGHLVWGDGGWVPAAAA